MQTQDFITAPRVFFTLLPIAVGLVIWFWQRAINTKTLKSLETEKELKAILATAHAELVARVRVLEQEGAADSRQLALLKQDMLPLSEFMKRKFIEALTHPAPEFEIPDALLAQVKKTGAPMPEALRPYLKERAESTNPNVSEYEKLAAEGLEVAVKMAELEASHPELVVTELQLVSSTLKSTETKRGEEASGEAGKQE